MPRFPRSSQIEASLFYHIYNRGNGKLDVFHDSADYEFFLYTMRRYKILYPISIYHWVLMSNHFHLVVSIEKPSLISKCIGGILQSYAQKHHKRWDSAGRLWQGRFASQPIQVETHLFECGRYIERNPVRAGMVRYPWEYKWSSCQYYVNSRKDDIITVDPVFCSFGENEQDRIDNYKAWLMEGEDKVFANFYKPVGSTEFIRQLEQKNGRLVKKKRRGRPRRHQLIVTS